MAAQVRSGRSCLLDRGFVILPVALLLNAPLQLPGGHGGNPAGEPPFFAFPDTPSVNNLTTTLLSHNPDPDFQALPPGSVRGRIPYSRSSWVRESASRQLPSVDSIQAFRNFDG